MCYHCCPLYFCNFTHCQETLAMLFYCHRLTANVLLSSWGTNKVVGRRRAARLTRCLIWWLCSSCWVTSPARSRSPQVQQSDRFASGCFLNFRNLESIIILLIMIVKGSLSDIITFIKGKVVIKIVVMVLNLVHRRRNSKSVNDKTRRMTLPF